MSRSDFPILAIDFGKKRFGIAVSDSKGIIATPVEVVHFTRRTRVDGVIDRIVEICEQYRVKRILVGSPQAFVKTHEKIGVEIDEFIDQIKLKLDLEIVKYDESFSTSNSKNMLLSLGVKQKNRKNNIDMYAASYFLQEFLDAVNRNGYSQP